MGIKNLKVILNSKCSCAINQRKLNCYSGMNIGIDISIFLYKYLYRNNDHIEGLTRLILRLLKNNITPIFIFDGKPPKEKDEIIQERKNKKEFLHMKREIIELVYSKKNVDFNEMKDNIYDYIKQNNDSYVIEDDKIKELMLKNSEELEEDIEKIKKKIIHIKSHHIDSSKKLFDLFGVQYIHAPCEAESFLANLCKNNIVDACITEDMDILANGGKLFLKNFSADKNYVDEYCLEGILENLEFTYDQFLDLCILCGCDYTSKIYGMGPINAYKLLKKFNNIENILINIKESSKYKIPDDFDYNSSRNLFKNPCNIDDMDIYKDKIKILKPNLDDLLDFLNNTKLHQKYIKDIKSNLMNYYLNIDSCKLFNEDKKEEVNNHKITEFFSKA